MGGDDSPSNLVSLTAKEHYIAHLLLTKITSGEDQKKMAMAVLFLGGKLRKDSKIKIHSRLFEELRIAANKRKSSNKLGTKNPNFGRPQDASAKLLNSKAMTGMVFWNNGLENRRAREWPGEGWDRGLLQNEDQKRHRSDKAKRQARYERTPEHKALMSLKVKESKKAARAARAAP